MSQWQPYSDKMKTEGELEFAGVYDHSGAVWATSGEGCGAEATPSQIVALVSVIQEQKHLEDGVKIGNGDFMVANVFEFENTCVMKKKNLPEDAQEKDKQDAVVALTGQTCLLGICAGGKGKGVQLKDAICRTQTYLKESGY